MKIAFSFPPIKSSKGIPLLTQNRQFQWFKNPTYIYPMIPASAATLLKQKGFEIIWDDAIAEETTYNSWFSKIQKHNPDFIIIESKTPVIKSHWKIVDHLKEKLPNTKIILCGDHVSAEPEETLNNSKTDYVLIGGDYDFLLDTFFKHYPNSLENISGLAYKANNNIIITSPYNYDNNLDTLPLIDRTLTRWKLYAYKNGNYKFHPGSYTMFGRDCWWRTAGGCTFCSWTNTFPKFRVVSPERAIQEVDLLLNLGVKEIFDDTGTFPTGNWLKTFCEMLIDRGLNKKLSFGCNMRPDALSLEEYNLMKRANFRLVLFGLESANNDTLIKINKGSTIENIVTGLKRAHIAGLESHVTIMLGYPWETKKDIEKTVNLAQDLFKKGIISTLQASLVIPYPGTTLYKECKEKDLLLFDNYDRFDQKELVMKAPISNKEAMQYIQKVYTSFMTPRFFIRKLLSIRSFHDIKYYMFAAKKVLSRFKDFQPLF